MSGKRNDASTRIWTPANIVTFVRICLVPVFVIALLSPWPEWFGLRDAISPEIKAVFAAVVFVVISCTDWIDGYLARSRQEVTDLGKFLDPLADKILVAAALIALVELQVLPSWPVLIILTREFIVSGIRMVAASKGYVIAASWYGKAKTVTQIIAIVMFLVKDALFPHSAEDPLANPMYIASWAMMLVALVLTIISMLDYIGKARPLLFPKTEIGNQEGNAPSSEAASDSGAEASASKAASDSEPMPSATELSDLFALDARIGELACSVVSAATSKGIGLATAESLTGGGIAEALTAVPGSSAVFFGGAVTYVNEAKHRMLGVSSKLLEDDGAVNAKTALEMAEGAASRLGADIAVSVTGIAGPTGAEPGKPVGTVYIGCCSFGVASQRRANFDGNREEVRKKTVICALETFMEQIESV